jgi:hypothetical protein
MTLARRARQPRERKARRLVGQRDHNTETKRGGRATRPRPPASHPGRMTARAGLEPRAMIPEAGSRLHLLASIRGVRGPEEADCTPVCNACRGALL